MQVAGIQSSSLNTRKNRVPVAASSLDGDSFPYIDQSAERETISQSHDLAYLNRLNRTLSNLA